MAAGRRRQRHAREEDALVALDQQVAAAADALGRERGEDLGHVRRRSCAGRWPARSTPGGGRPGRSTGRRPGRRRSAASTRRAAAPARAAPSARARGPRSAGSGGRSRAGSRRVPDDGVEPDRLQRRASRSPLKPERGDDLVERQDQVDVVGLAAQPVRQPGQHLAAADAQEVVLDVGAREPGVSRHDGDPGVSRRPAAGPSSSRCQPVTLRTVVRPSRSGGGAAP